MIQYTVSSIEMLIQSAIKLQRPHITSFYVHRLHAHVFPAAPSIARTPKNLQVLNKRSIDSCMAMDVTKFIKCSEIM